MTTRKHPRSGTRFSNIHMARRSFSPFTFRISCVDTFDIRLQEPTLERTKQYYFQPISARRDVFCPREFCHAKAGLMISRSYGGDS